MPLLYRIYAIVFMDVVAGSLLWPAWPSLVASTAYPQVWMAGASALFVGIQLVTAPLLGKLSDVTGRKPVLIMSAVGTFFANLLLLPLRPWGFLANRALDGCTNGVYAAIRSAIGDISKEEEVVKNVGIEGSIVSMAFVLGPMLGAGVLWILDTPAAGSTQVLVYMGVVLSSLNILICWWVPETRHTTQRVNLRELWGHTLDALNLVAQLRRLRGFARNAPGLLRLVVMQLAVTLCLGYYSHITLFVAIGELHMDVREISQWFASFGAATLVSNFIFYKYLIDKIDHRVTIIWVSLIGLVTMIAYAWVGTSVTALYVVTIIDCFTLSILPGLVDGLLTERTEADTRGEVLGLVQALSGVASFATILVYGPLSVFSMTLPFYWFALCLAPVAWLGWKVRG